MQLRERRERKAQRVSVDPFEIKITKEVDFGTRPFCQCHFTVDKNEAYENSIT